jgi:hypothetical protein
VILIICLLLLSGVALPQTLSEPPRQVRPAWWREQGVAIAGGWEPLAPRLRGGGADNYEKKLDLWRYEHSEELGRRLKEMGFNLIMIPLYKGASLADERAGMEDAKRFTAILHKLGLKVGCYTFSGTILYESMYAERPSARDWLILDPRGNPATYNGRYYRRWVDRSHPGVRALMRELVRYAVQEARVDLVHFDNYMVAPGYEPYSVEQFRQFLKKKYTPEQRAQRFGFPGVDYIEPPPPGPEPEKLDADPLVQDFVDYRCQAQADTYRELADYARSLNPEVLVECNPHGYYGALGRDLNRIGAVDHTRMLPYGSAFWDEGHASRLENDVMITRFRSAKLGRWYGNMVFQYTPDRVSMAESMAGNLQCLGNPVWYEGREIVPTPSMRPASVDSATLNYVKFFRGHQELFRDAEEIADVGVLHTYANSAFGPPETLSRAAAFEQALYQGKIPFTLVPDRYPGNLGRFRVLAMPDLALVSDRLLDAVREFVRKGGGLVLTGDVARFDEQRHRRERPGLEDLFAARFGAKILYAKPGAGRAVYVPYVQLPPEYMLGMQPVNRRQLLDAVRWAAGAPLAVDVRAPESVTMNLYRQPSGRRLLHLVNYDDAHPVAGIDIVLRPATGRGAVTMFSPDLKTSLPIAATREGGALRFRIPKLDIYTLLAVE